MQKKYKKKILKKILNEKKVQQEYIRKLVYFIKNMIMCKKIHMAGTINI